MTIKKNGSRDKNNSPLKVFKARWVLPMSSEPLEHGCVLVCGNIIERVLPANQLEDQLSEYIAGRDYIFQDYGEAIILPGLINLHTHLEHTNLKELAQESAFFAWLPKLMEATAAWSIEDRMASAKNGVMESILAGTTTVVDFSYNGTSVIPLAESGLRALVGLETFGIDESAVEGQWQQWLDRRNSLLSNSIVKMALQDERLAITVSPHAPYTVCPALWQKAKIWSKDNNLPILTHLAESKEEFNWFYSQDVDLNKDLKQFLIYAFGKRTPHFAQLYDLHTSWKSANLSPVEYLHRHALLTDNLLAAHSVQINEQDINLLKASGVSIAHCPNSNVTLRCGRAPLEKLLANDVKVGLGTDSAASSNNLNLLTEAAFAISLHKSCASGFEIEAKEALALITIKAAQCLGLEHKLGSLQEGKLADMGVFKLPSQKVLNQPGEADPYLSLIQGACLLEELFINGKSVYHLSY